MHIQLQSKQRQAKLVITYGSKLAKLKYLYLLTINLNHKVKYDRPGECRVRVSLGSVR